MDGSGYTGGNNTIAQFNIAPELASRLAEITDRYPALQAVEPWPESNHSTFAFRGVPALAFSARGAFALAHSPADTIEMVSLEKLTEVVAVVSQIVAVLR